MKVLLKIVAALLIGIGVIILIGGIYALVTNPSDITTGIIVLVIAGGFIFCVIKLWRKANRISKGPHKSRQRNLSKLMSLFLQDYEKGNYSWKEFVNDNPINKTKVNEKALKRFGLSLYKITLSKTLKDLCFSDVEQRELDEIAKCFSLTENETATINSSFADEATSRLVERKLSDKIITDDEKEELYIFGAALGLRQ
jgi:hypothetical protein